MSTLNGPNLSDLRQGRTAPRIGTEIQRKGRPHKAYAVAGANLQGIQDSAEQGARNPRTVALRADCGGIPPEGTRRGIQETRHGQEQLPRDIRDGRGPARSGAQTVRKHADAPNHRCPADESHR